MTARLRAGLAAATLAAASLLACGDPNAPRASLATYTDTLQLYALNGSPLGAPSALRLIAGAAGTPAVPLDAAFAFDLALDIGDDGAPAVYPVRTLASPFLSKHRVGVARTTQPFDAITEAPTVGYQHDSVAAVAVGEVLLIESTDTDVCTSLVGNNVLYGKMVIDSVRPATRRLFVRLTADPNCGFRSFESGVPKR